MRIYTCERCLKDFNHKTHYTTHLIRKIPCEINEKSKINPNKILSSNTIISPSVLLPSSSIIIPQVILESEINQNINIIKLTDNTCPKCYKKFFQKSNVTKHIQNKSCKLKNILTPDSIINESSSNIKIILETHQNELKLKDQKIQLLQDSFIKKQRRKNYPEKNVIYMLTTEDNKNKRIYIIGKATNLKRRLSGYNKTAEHEVTYYKSCNTEEDMNLIELIVLKKLKLYRVVPNLRTLLLEEFLNLFSTNATSQALLNLRTPFLN
jgi:hypothetical protein